MTKYLIVLSLDSTENMQKYMARSGAIPLLLDRQKKHFCTDKRQCISLWLTGGSKPVLLVANIGRRKDVQLQRNPDVRAATQAVGADVKRRHSVRHVPTIKSPCNSQVLTRSTVYTRSLKKHARISEQSIK